MKRFLVTIAALYACVIACDDGPQSHVYVAMLYEPAGNCLDPSTTLQIIGTPNGSLLCEPACLVEDAPPAVGTEMVWVSTMCGPYPSFITDMSGTDPACALALAAFEAGTVCGVADDAGPGESGPGDGASGDDGGSDAGDSGQVTDASDAGDSSFDADAE